MTRSDVHSGPTLPEAIQLARFHVDSLHIGAEGELWTVYDSSLDGYLEALGGVIGNDSLIDRMGRRALAITARPMIVVDLMATTAAIRSLVERTGANVNGLSVSLTDDRRERQKEADSKLGIRHLAGDLGNSATWRTMRGMLGGEKADFIISSGVGGLHYLPRHPQYYSGVVNRVWGMLNPDEGTLILEVPTDRILESVGAPPIEQVSEDLAGQGICAIARSGRYSSALYIERQPRDPSVLFPM